MQLAERLLGLRIEEMADHVLRSFAIGAGQLFLRFRIAQPDYVVQIVRIEFLDLLSGRRVHYDQRGLVASDVRRRIDHFIVGREHVKAYLVLERGGQHRTERLLFRLPVQNLRVDAVDDRIGDPQLAVVIGHPALNGAGVLGQQRHLARVEVEPVRVEYLRIALVRADDNQRIDLFERIDDLRPHAGNRRVGPRVAAVQIDAVELVILIAAGVLQVEQPVVVGPEVSGDVAVGLGGDSPRRVGTRLLHEDVHPRFVRSHIGKVLAVGRDVVGTDFGIAEKLLERNFPHMAVAARPYERNDDRRHPSAPTHCFHFRYVFVVISANVRIVSGKYFVVHIFVPFFFAVSPA